MSIFVFIRPISFHLTTLYERPHGVSYNSVAYEKTRNFVL